jgi:hypothetical protein
VTLVKIILCTCAVHEIVWSRCWIFTGARVIDCEWFLSKITVLLCRCYIAVTRMYVQYVGILFLRAQPGQLILKLTEFFISKEGQCFTACKDVMPMFACQSSQICSFLCSSRSCHPVFK